MGSVTFRAEVRRSARTWGSYRHYTVVIFFKLYLATQNESVSHRRNKYSTTTDIPIWQRKTDICYNNNLSNNYNSHLAQPQPTVDGKRFISFCRNFTKINMFLSDINNKPYGVYTRLSLHALWIAASKRAQTSRTNTVGDTPYRLFVSLYFTAHGTDVYLMAIIYYHYFASASVTVDSSHTTASSST